MTKIRLKQNIKSLRVKAQINGDMIFFLNFLDLTSSSMFERFSINPIEPSIAPDMVVALEIAGLKCDV